MANSKNTAGKRVFDDAYSFPADLQDLADDIISFANLRVGTSAERQAFPIAQTKLGMSWQETDTSIRYVYTVTGWIPVEGRLVGRVKRSATAQNIPSAGYFNASGNTLWDADLVSGFAAYNNGWTMPLTGRYNFSYEVRSSAAFLAGLAVNTQPATPSLILATTTQAVQGVSAATVSATAKLNAGDIARIYLLAATGTPAWAVSVGSFSVEWVGAD